MLYALDKYKNKISPSKNIKAYCPLCGSELIAKCGELNIWHFSHKIKSNCSYSGGETKWHLSWKKDIHKNNCEVIIEKNNLKKIADIQLDDGVVVELQHSPITPQEVRFRNNFYGKIYWLFDYSDSENIIIKDKNTYFTFSWIYFPKKMFELFENNKLKKNMKLFIHTKYDDKIILIKTLYKAKFTPGYNGSCEVYTIKQFKKSLQNNCKGKK